MAHPLVSFCIFSYNQENFIEDALLGAVGQTYSPLEIIISDDCSVDGTYAVIQSFVANYQGEHRIIVNRNEQNLGITKHFNKVCYQIAGGEIIVLAGGDDVSLPERVQKTVECFDRFPEAMSLSFESEQVDVDLRPLNPDSTELSTGSTSLFTLEDYTLFRDFIIFSGDSRAVRRKVIDSFPPLGLAKAEDIFLFIRSLMTGAICYVREPLVKRRIHGHNASSSVKKEELDLFLQQELEDIAYALERGYINPYEAQRLTVKVKQVRSCFYKAYLISHYPRLYRFLSKTKHLIKR